MSGYRSINAAECAELLLTVKHPTVIMHIHPDGDTVGTAAALLALYRRLGISASYSCADKIPVRLAFLLEGYEECLDFAGRDIITVDIATPKQMGELSRLAPGVRFMIDHHEVGEPFAPAYIIGGMSSAGEVLLCVVHELAKMGKITLTKDIAEPLYAAISSDTGRFCYSNATAETYRRAAELIEAGIDHASINHRLFNSKPKEQILAEGLISSKIRTAAGGRIAYATLTRAERAELGVASEHFETAIDIIRSTAGAEIAFFVREIEQGKIKASLRSVDKNVAEIAKSFGGGGHILAAGCTIDTAESVEAAAKLLLERTEALFA